MVSLQGIQFTILEIGLPLLNIIVALLVYDKLRTMSIPRFKILSNVRVSVYDRNDSFGIF